MCIWAIGACKWGSSFQSLRSASRSFPIFDPEWKKAYPKKPPITLAALETLYPEAAAACKSDPARLEAARRATNELQAGRRGYRALWKHFRDISLKALQPSFEALGAHFDLFEGESGADPLIAPLIAELRASGIAVESEGAIVVPVAEDGDTKPVPPLLLSKSDGAALYATTDLATLQDRICRLGAQRVVYVVDQRQALHFEQVFRAARKAGFAKDVRLDHIGFGTVNGKDGKALKTREGGTVKLADLLAEAVAMAAARLEQSEHGKGFSAGERAEIARRIGIAAVKFADLSSNRMSGYIFDAEKLVSFEGKTGAYLQFACVRIASILAKAAERGASPGALAITHAAERVLILECLRFPEVAASAAGSLLPSEIAEYAYRLAQQFSRFYTECRVLDEADPDARASRLTLCRLTHAVLERALWLLGIGVPARM